MNGNEFNSNREQNYQGTRPMTGIAGQSSNQQTTNHSFYQESSQPSQMAQVPYQQTNYQQPTYQAQESQPKNPMDVVTSLNKEEAMEEALSHTTQFSPFEISKEEVREEVEKNKKSDKKTLTFMIVIFILLILFIIFLPQISKLFGW